MLLWIHALWSTLLEIGTPEISRQRRTERRHARRQTAIVARQLGKLVGRGVVLGIVKFRSRLLLAAAAIERPDDGAEHGNDGDAGKPDEYFAGKSCHRRALRVEAEIGGEFAHGFRGIAAHHLGLPSVRTIRTFC